MITGASGFLGKRLVSYYKKQYEILAVSHADLDFTDANQVSEIVNRFHPDVIIHCGAIADVSTCAQNPELSMDVNVNGTRNLAKASAQVGARFVFCSSDQVYFSGQNHISLAPHKENEELSPMPLYGQHKLLAEQACLSEQPDSVILRLTWMYDKLTVEETAQGRRNLLTLLDYALSSQESVTFSTTDYRGVTDVHEVVCQMEKAWMLPAGIYNYGSSNATNMYETIHHVLDTLGQTSLLIASENGNLRNIAIDNSKAGQFGIHFSDTAEGLIKFYT